MEEFDYVVVGAGSAGCVLANRLTEGGKHTVKLLESGPRDSYPWIHIPIGYAKTMFNDKYTVQHAGRAARTGDAAHGALAGDRGVA